jgi:hypothetical protein
MRNATIGNWTWRLVAIVATVLALILALRVLQSERQPDLEPWHTWAPNEPDAGEIDELDWSAWLAREGALMKDLRAHLGEALDAADRVAANRYFDGSPLNSARFAHDWNRSYELLPAGDPVGAVVLLHGLSDSPYSLRHVAQAYVDHGYAAIGLRLPRAWHRTRRAHARALAGLARGRAAGHARSAPRGGTRQAPWLSSAIPTAAPLALQYTLDAVSGAGLEVPARVVLVSPMIGLTRFARYAGIAGWPALLPRFSKSAWLDIVPEFNPFKYNSFRSTPRASRMSSRSGSMPPCKPPSRAAPSRRCHRCWRSSRWWTPRWRVKRWSARCSRACRRMAANWCCST